MFRSFSLKRFDFLLVALIGALNYCGLLAIRSAASELYDRQLTGICIGLGLMLAVSVVDYHLILKIHWVLYAASIALLVMVLYAGSSGGGAQRWFSLFGITFQPSEAAKILLILFFAEFIISYRKWLVLPLHLLACIVLIIPPVFLVYKEPDLSTSVMLLLIFCVMMFS